MKTFIMFLITFLLLFPCVGNTTKPDFDLVRLSSITKKTIKEPVDGVVESGNFMIILTIMPLYDVVITISSSDPGEAKVSPSSIRFTPYNYCSPQTITVTGVADYVIDGDQKVGILISATSCDPLYDGIEVDPIEVIVENVDYRVVMQGTISLVDGSPPDSSSSGGGCLLSP